MQVRDLFIHCSLSQQEVYHVLRQLLSESGKSTQAGQSAEQQTYYIIQPEEILLIIEHTSSSETGTDAHEYPYHVCIQPYNLPDPMDQRRVLETFPDQLLNQLKEKQPDWKLVLHPLLQKS